MSNNYHLPFAALKMSLPSLLFSFKGRIPRSTWWVSSGATLAVALLAMSLIENIATKSSDARSVAYSIGTVFFGVVIWVGLALGVKRWHDMDRSAWLSLLPVLPYIGVIAFIYYGFVRGTKGPNRFGDDPLLNEEANKLAVVMQKNPQPEASRPLWPS